MVGTTLSWRRDVDSRETLAGVSMVTVHFSGYHVGGLDSLVGRVDQISVYGGVVRWTIHFVDLCSSCDHTYSVFDT